MCPENCHRIFHPGQMQTLPFEALGLCNDTTKHNGGFCNLDIKHIVLCAQIMSQRSYKRARKAGERIFLWEVGCLGRWILCKTVLQDTEFATEIADPFLLADKIASAFFGCGPVAVKQDLVLNDCGHAWPLSEGTITWLRPIWQARYPLNYVILVRLGE